VGRVPRNPLILKSGEGATQPADTKKWGGVRTRN